MQNIKTRPVVVQLNVQLSIINMGPGTPVMRPEVKFVINNFQPRISQLGCEVPCDLSLSNVATDSIYSDKRMW